MWKAKPPTNSLIWFFSAGWWKEAADPPWFPPEPIPRLPKLLTPPRLDIPGIPKIELIDEELKLPRPLLGNKSEDGLGFWSIARYIC